MPWEGVSSGLEALFTLSKTGQRFSCFSRAPKSGKRDVQAILSRDSSSLKPASIWGLVGPWSRHPLHQYVATILGDHHNNCHGHMHRNRLHQDLCGKSGPLSHSVIGSRYLSGTLSNKLIGNILGLMTTPCDANVNLFPPIFKYSKPPALS